MKHYYHAKSNTYMADGDSFTVGANQYPANWFSLASADDIARHGFTEVRVEGTRADERFFDNAEVTNLGVTYITSTPKPLSSIKQYFSEKIAESRYNLEVAGIQVNGATIKTDRESQALVSGAMLLTMRNPDAVINWKAGNGWSSLTKAELEAVADAVSGHVQACFTAERAKQQELKAITDFTALINFDPTVTL